MKITQVQAFGVEWKPGHTSAWVRIEDDQGRFGMGEVSPMEGGRASMELVESSLKQVLMGAETLDTSVLFHRMFHRFIKTGPDGALAAAIAAVDIALWDLKGKILGQPIYKLLGGAWRTELPFYASIGDNAWRSVDEVVAVVEKWLTLSPALVKIRFDADKTTRDKDIAQDIAKARAVRKLVGEKFPLSFDANNGYSVQGAIRVGRMLEELGYTWFEEPCQSYHVQNLGKVAQALDIAVAAGEQEYTLQGVQRLIEAGVDIVQPDIVKTGGFTGMQQMAALAHAYGVDLLPHQTQPTIGQTANLHLSAALLHGHYPVEYSDGSGFQNVVLREPVGPVNGVFKLPMEPGLGLVFDEVELARRVRPWR